jgi:hypothetical protein
VDRPVRLALIGVVIVTMAACSSTATPSPTGTPAGAATPTTAVQATSTPAGNPTEALPSFVLPHDAAGLEALLPDKLGTETLVKTSSTGAEFAAQGGSTPALVAWLQGLGKSLADISTATAIAPTAETTILAFRVNGVDHSILIAGLQKAVDTGLSTTTPWTSGTVGGKSVQTTELGGGAVYLYGVADIIFEVYSNDAALSAEALSKLP